MKRTTVVLCGFALLASISPARADHHEAPGDEKGHMHEGEMKEMSPEEKAAMEAWTKAATPGERHEELAESAGTWTMEIKIWMGPEEEVSTGTAERKMILDGRVLKEKVKGTMMGDMPFEGLGFTGYDNVIGKYWSTWMDSASTGVATSRGTWDEEKGAVVFEGEMSDPMTGESSTFWSTFTPSEGKEVFTMYQMMGGEKVKTMEITYTRK